MQTLIASHGESGDVLKSGQHLPALTSMRFFCGACGVLLPRLRVQFADPALWTRESIRRSAIRILVRTHISRAGIFQRFVFFILTGFVIAWSSKPNMSAFEFRKRRVLRVYPPHIVTWALAMALFAAAYTPGSVALANLALLHGFNPSPSIYVSANPPSWSLVNDMLFYAIFPFLAAPFARFDGRTLWTIAIAATIGIELLNQYVVTDQPKSPITPISGTQFWFGYISPIARIPEFLLGVTLARLVRAGLWPRIRLSVAWALLAVAYIVGNFLPFIYAITLTGVIPLAILIASTAENELRGQTPNFLSSAWMQKLGHLSFGFYIAQGLTVFYLRTLLPNESYGAFDAFALILASLAITFFAGWLLFTFVETPAIALARKIHIGRSLASSAA